jgi:hypothetical protein
MVFLPFQARGKGMSENSSHGGIVDSLGDVIRGDIPIARYIFNDPSKRRLISRLKAEGWPIFDLAGKNAARRSDLSAEIKARARKARA